MRIVTPTSAGLTRVEAENAFSLSLVRHGRLAPDVLWEIKAGALVKSGRFDSEYIVTLRFPYLENREMLAT